MTQTELRALGAIDRDEDALMQDGAASTAVIYGSPAFGETTAPSRCALMGGCIYEAELANDGMLLGSLEVPSREGPGAVRCHTARGGARRRTLWWVPARR